MGYAAGVCGGRSSGTAAQGGGKHGDPVKTQVMAATKSKEDEEWCTDTEMVNVSAAKLKKLEQLIKECKFDSTPLGKAICWKCGRILYSNVVTSRTCLVLPLKGMTQAEAPASA